MRHIRTQDQLHAGERPILGRLGAAPLALLLGLVLVTGCVDSGKGGGASFKSASCMTCHNGSTAPDYSGPGLENPHPFPGADQLGCVDCHGGNGQGQDQFSSHIPPPPQIGDRTQQITDKLAWFNRLTLAGMDKFADYQVAGNTYNAIDYLQFINPGDLRVVSKGRSCGTCHSNHSAFVNASLLNTGAGIFSGAAYAAGIENKVPESVGLYEDTAADLSFRPVSDPNFSSASLEVGDVARLLEQPVFSEHGVSGTDKMFNNNAYNANDLQFDQDPNGRVAAGSHLANLYHEMISTTCGDCHLGSAGANNRAGDFRSSGCTACHMPYSLGGRSGSNDPHVNKTEPLDPDDIDPPELSHVRAHRIVSTFKTLPGGTQVQGIDDMTCAGCHQGSNRTVMQYWGIRLDQNQDVKNNRQYPVNPASYKNSFNDPRLFDPVVNNKTFNGRNHNQYLVEEDYDGDTRDDTPPDIHYEKGLGCIDCHGSYDLHGGDVNDPSGPRIASRMEQAVAIRCVSCHGEVDAPAPTTQAVAFDGDLSQVAMDSKGNPLKHVVREADGNLYLYSKLTGVRHFVSQTVDHVVDSGKLHPTTGQPLYSQKASYAMGRADGNPSTGTGPQQTGSGTNGFSHADNLSCEACHSSWTNTCMGCHLGGEYSNNQNLFSNINGKRIVFEEDDADFVYQSPVFFQLGVNSDGKIGQMSPNTKTFFYYEDQQNNKSKVFSFSDRQGHGNNPADGTPSLSHNVMLAHSIRGKVTAEDEGPRYCNACHLTDNSMANWGTEYDSFRTAIQGGDYGSLNFNLLQDHIGANTGNDLDSPMWVHMVAGLGSGMFLFDENGCPVNPLDTFANRVGCQDSGGAPANNFDPLNVALDLDRIVTETGAPTGSGNHPLFTPGSGSVLRDGPPGNNPNMAGPLGATLVERLTDPATGIVLDSWIDADGTLRGDAPTNINNP